MDIKRLNTEAFTLLEVLLAAIIFIISIAGVFVTLNAIRIPVLNKENQLSATVFSKQVLDALYSQVNAQATTNFYGTCNGTCTTFDLQLGTHQVSYGTFNALGLSFPTSLCAYNNDSNGSNPSCAITVLNYTVQCADNSSTCNSNTNPNVARQVNLQVNWPSLP